MFTNSFCVKGVKVFHEEHKTSNTVLETSNLILERNYTYC